MKRLIAACLLALCALAPAAHAQKPEDLASRVTSVEATSVTAAGTFGGVDYVKIAGVVRGQIGPGDFAAVHNLIALKQAAYPGVTPFPYESNFEMIVPAPGQPANEVIYVDSENRGSAISQGALGGFLQNHKTSYARVQWQTGISKGVPADAQGVGLVIMRDFARWLGGRSPGSLVGKGPDARLALGAVPCNSNDCLKGYRPYSKLMLGGISQSAWLVNTFVAEGFNQEPITGKRIFDAAIAIDGAGNWLAINQIAAARGVKGQNPYVDPNGVPLTREELLHHPRTDPLYVDVANYTDFYRLRAGLTSTAESTPTFRRYDWPSPHANSANPRCNNGQPIVVNPVRYSAYFRALVLNMEKAIGVKAAQSAPGLPPSTVFSLTPTPVKPPLFNPLPGADVKVPVVDQNGWPVGGVRFADAAAPAGRPDPVAVPPVDTTGISNTCGNSGGWKPWDAAQLTGRYTDKAGYLGAYQTALDALIRQGFLLPEDRAGLLKAAEANWTAA